MIEAAGLVKRYGGVPVLEEVSLTVAAGSCLALLGPNGAGKTTLLRILATLLRPTSGTLRIAGVDALRDPEAARPLIGMVGHGSWVYEDLTAVENLRFWAALQGHPRSPDDLRQALARVDLLPVADERARTFSAGMKRRLALARLSLGGARMLLLDEPFSSLDRQGQKWFEEYLLTFRSGGGSVVLATHSFGRGIRVADRVAILAAGRLVLDRAAADLPWEELRRLYDTLTEANGGPA